MHNSPIRSPSAFRTIALIGRYHSPEVAESLRALGRFLSQRGVVIVVESDTARNVGGDLPWEVKDFPAIGQDADLAIVLGGDGTMLNAARQLAPFRVPLVGVNQGRLGFMTDIGRHDMLSCMEDLLEGRFTRDERLVLAAVVSRDGKDICVNQALNDVVVDKGAIGKMIEFELFIDGEFIYHLRADGLIVSTPTGSTAYALSANGPILHPNLGGIALVPLCPHALTNRPVTVSERCDIELRITHAADARVHFDGQLTFDLKRGDCVHMRKAAHSTCFLHPPGYSYFAMLRQKLQWSERPKGV